MNAANGCTDHDEPAHAGGQLPNRSTDRAAKNFQLSDMTARETSARSCDATIPVRTASSSFRLSAITSEGFFQQCDGSATTVSIPAIATTGVWSASNMALPVCTDGACAVDNPTGSRGLHAVVPRMSCQEVSL